MARLNRASVCTLARCLAASALSAWPVAAAKPCVAAEPTLTATWQAAPLREVASRVTGSLGVPVVVSRRIDPSTAITLEASAEPAIAALKRIAAEAAAEVVILMSSVRIEPSDRVGRLLAADEQRRDDLRRLTARSRQRLLELGPLAWQAGATPAEIVSGAARDAGVRIGGLDRLRHDQLAAARLPPMPLIDRIDLVLFDYDLRARPVGDTLEIVPIDESARPRGPRRTSLPARRRPAGGGEPGERFTLTAAAPLEELLTAIAGRLGLTLELDREGLMAAAVDPARIVRLEVREVDRDGLLDAVTEPLGLTWKLEGTRLEVTAR